MIFYEVGVSLFVLGDGKRKKATLLVDAQSFTEAEGRATQWAEGKEKEFVEFQVKTIKKSAITCCVGLDDMDEVLDIAVPEGLAYFKIEHKFGDSKSKMNVAVRADDTDEATKRFFKWLGKEASFATILTIDKTNIVDVVLVERKEED
jgi:hypothetical protein